MMSRFLKKLVAFASVALVLVTALFTNSAQAAAACTPTTGYNKCVRFTYTGANQSITIPTGVSNVNVRVWGAAGGGGVGSPFYYAGTNAGGSGGFASGDLAVTSGQTLTVVSGQGGVQHGTGTTYGGGGGGGDSSATNARGGSGGGYSGVFSAGTPSQATALIMAGGGGGSSPGDGAIGNGSTYNGSGGGGGAVGGQDANSVNSGRGGTQTAGGAAATGVNNCSSSAATAGAVLLGGKGTSSNSGGEGGGGGGGGYYGGGGGLCQIASSAYQNGGGGGGSGFLSSSISNGAMTSGATNLSGNNTCPAAGASGGSGDALYSSGIGLGQCTGNGGNGEVVIQYSVPSIKLSKTSTGGNGTNAFGFGIAGGITDYDSGTTNTAVTGGTTTDSITTTSSTGTTSTTTSSKTFYGTIGTGVTITENSFPATWPTKPINVVCTDANAPGNNNPSGNLVTFTGASNNWSIPAANMLPTAKITCTVTNDKTPPSDLSVVLNIPTASGPGATNTGKITCSNAATAGSAAGVTCTATAVDSAGASVPVTVSGCSTVAPATLVAGASMTCDVSYTMPGTVGGADTPQTSVTLTGTTSTTTAGDPTSNNTTTVTTGIVDAINDTTDQAANATGIATAVHSNDQGLGNKTFIPIATGATAGGMTSTCPGIVATANVSGAVTYNTPAKGFCTVVYSVCANNLTASQFGAGVPAIAVVWQPTGTSTTQACDYAQLVVGMPPVVTIKKQSNGGVGTFNYTVTGTQ